MAVQETSRIALGHAQKTLNENQRAVYEVIQMLGPTHDKRICQVLNQKEKARHSKKRWAINMVTPRRLELYDMGRIWRMGKYQGVWYGKKLTCYLYKPAYDNREEPKGWVRLPTQPVTKPQANPIELQKRINARQQQTSARIMTDMNASTAGAVLAGMRHNKPKNEKQELLFQI